MDWFLYDRDLCHERVNHTYKKFITNQKVVKKENKFSRSRNFDFKCWLEKQL